MHGVEIQAWAGRRIQASPAPNYSSTSSHLPNNTIIGKIGNQTAGKCSEKYANINVLLNWEKKSKSQIWFEKSKLKLLLIILSNIHSRLRLKITFLLSEDAWFKPVTMLIKVHVFDARVFRVIMWTKQTRPFVNHDHVTVSVELINNDVIDIGGRKKGENF